MPALPVRSNLGSGRFYIPVPRISRTIGLSRDFWNSNDDGGLRFPCDSDGQFRGNRGEAGLRDFVGGQRC